MKANARATLRFDRRVRLEFRGATINAGLLVLDDARLTETANECLQSRGGHVQHRLVGHLRQSYSRLAGYEDTTLNGWPRTRRCGSWTARH